jgi:hypothetical protein
MKKLITILFIGLLLTGCTKLPDPPFGADLAQDRLIKINSIADTVAIGEKEKQISFTDDNTGENFIIKSDYGNYATLGGDIMVYFSVTNVSGLNQDANILFSMAGGQFIRSVERFDGNTITTETIQETTQVSSSTKAITIDKAIEHSTANWTTIFFDNFDVTKTEIVRKSVLNNKADKNFKDNFKVNETKYYRAVISVPLQDEKKEWFIEAFGINYGHLDPNLWVYEQKFNDLNTATIIGQDSWALTTGVNASTLVVETNTPAEGTKHLYIKDDRQERIYRSITSLVSGTMYISMKAEATNTWAVFLLVGTGGDLFDIYFNGTTNNIEIPYATTALTSFSAGAYYRIGIQFETGAGGWEGLSADTYKYNINGGTWSAAKNFYQAVSDVNRIKVENAGTVANNDFWVDYISPNYSDAVATVPYQDPGYQFEEE